MGRARRSCHSWPERGPAGRPRATPWCPRPRPGRAAAARPPGEAGRDSTTPGVSAHPGWLACTPTCWPAHRDASSGSSSTWARLDRAYAVVRSSRRSGTPGPSARRPWAYIPPEVTSTTRASWPASRSRSSSVMRDRAEHVQPPSSACALWRLVRSAGSAPALWTRTSRRATSSSSAKRRTSSRSATSQAVHGDVGAGHVREQLRAHPLALLDVADHQPDPRPQPGHASAAARPSPEVGPGDGDRAAGERPGAGSSGQVGSRRRTAGPTRVKPGATVCGRAGCRRRGRGRGEAGSCAPP